MTKFSLSKRSLSRLEGVEPRLISVTKRAIELTVSDFLVIQGVRTVEEALTNWGKGRTAEELTAAGVDPSYAQPTLAKVTWVGHPLSTKHLIQPDGFGHAVDLAPYRNGNVDWEYLAGFAEIANAMKHAAAEQKTEIVWGGDWKTSVDLPHFQIAT